MKIKFLTILLMAMVMGMSVQAQFIFDGDSTLIDPDNHVIVGDDTSHVDWTTQYVEAKGWNVIDTVKFPNKAQAKAMARRGAVVDAQRNLLECIKGVRIVGETTVKNMVTEGDYIYSRLEGVLQGAETVGEPIFEDGMVEVRMRVPLYKKSNGKEESVAGVIQNSMGVTPLKLNESDSGGKQEQIAFNLNGKTLDPALFPQIIDKDGNVVLDFSKYYDPKTGKFPQYMKLTKEAFEAAGYDKGTQFIDVLDATGGKIKIDTDKLPGNKKINWKKVGTSAVKLGSFLMMLL